jgi:hypothetical protein
VSWYLRSMADQDTHRGELGADGLVVADCGARFPPFPLPFGRVALPGHPYDPDQTCPRCQQAARTLRVSSPRPAAG